MLWNEMSCILARVLMRRHCLSRRRDLIKQAQHIGILKIFRRVDAHLASMSGHSGISCDEECGVYYNPVQCKAKLSHVGLCALMLYQRKLRKTAMTLPEKDIKNSSSIGLFSKALNSLTNFLEMCHHIEYLLPAQNLLETLRFSHSTLPSVTARCYG